MPKNGTMPIRDLNSTNAPKRADVTDAQRLTVLEAVLNGRTLLEAGSAAGVTRFDAEAIATCAGWSDRARVQAARDRYAAEVGS